MIVLLDIGNTRIKLAWLACPAGSLPMSTPLAISHDQLSGLADLVPQAPDAVLASNVAAHEVRHALEQYCRQNWGQSVHWLDTHHGRHLLQNAYHEPHQLGADRWLAMLGLLQHARHTAAWQQGSPCLLASFGTATTIDTLLPPGTGGRHELPLFAGGLILPGYKLMGSSLAQGTARLPHARGKSTGLPRNTHDAIASGIAAAQGGALLQQWRHALQAGNGRPPLVFVSGGAWSAVRHDIESCLQQAGTYTGLAAPAPIYLQSPVLDGLASLWQP